MNNRASKNLFQFFFIIITAFALSSCTSNDGGFPQIADAPPFDYADGEELRSRMHQLAFELQNLDRELAIEYDERQPDQSSVVDNLRNIDRIATSLQSGEIDEKHPFLAESMGKFLSDVERAEWDASRNRYYMAGRIAGSCVSCHRSTY